MSISREEQAYRRGMHQAFALAYRFAVRTERIEDIREKIGLAEDAAELSRNQPTVYDGGMDFVAAYVAEHMPAHVAR